MKVLGPATDFLTWRSGKGTENHREFDFEGQRDLITELTQDWGNRLLEGTHTHTHTHTQLGCTRTQEKGAVTPQETEPDLPVSVQEFQAEAWVNTDLPWGQGH